MNDCPWQTIDQFRNHEQVNRFVEWMNQQIGQSQAREVPVGQRYVGSSLLQEKWFQHSPSGAIWRLVWPDPPFAGLFEPVTSEAHL